MMWRGSVAPISSPVQRNSFAASQFKVPVSYGITRFAQKGTMDSCLQASPQTRLAVQRNSTAMALHQGRMRHQLQAIRRPHCSKRAASPVNRLFLTSTITLQLTSCCPMMFQAWHHREAGRATMTAPQPVRSLTATRGTIRWQMRCGQPALSGLQVMHLLEAQASTRTCRDQQADV